MSTLIINTIPTQSLGVQFNVTGSFQLPNSTWTEILEYKDDNGNFNAVPASPVLITISNFFYPHPGNLPVGTHTVSVKDPFTGEVVVSNSFLVQGVSTIAVTPPVVSSGSLWTLSGVLTGYIAAPALTYRLDGGPATVIPSGGITTTSFTLAGIPALTTGMHSVQVSDGVVSSPPVTFTVATPLGVIHITTPSGVTAGATFVLAGTLSNYLTVPQLSYTLDNSPTPIAISGETLTAFSVTVTAPGVVGNHIISVTDGTSTASITLVVNAPAGAITVFTPSGVIAGQSFTFTGVLSNYATIPALTYTISPGGSPVTMTGISVTGWAMTVVVATAGNYTVTVTDGTISSSAVAFTVTQANIPTVTRNWYENYGQNGSFWVQPFQNTANWITSGALVTALRGGTPSVNLRGNFATPTYIGKATDPDVTVTDGINSIVVKLPIGAVIETPDSAVDNSIGGTDMTRPYIVWSISGAKIYNASNQQISSINGPGCVIRGTYGLAVQDGAGLIMVDAVTGQPGDGNANGLIQEYELGQILNDPNYIIQHMLQFQLDVTQASSAGPIWPLKIIDGGAVYTGIIPQGITIGIPANVLRPTGMSRGKSALWDAFQQFGGFNYNFGATGGVNIEIYNNNAAYNSLVSDMVSSWPSVAANLCILNYANGVAGAQYNLATTKGAVPGSTNAFPAPPPLNLSPTNGKNVAPSTFGAWYPSGYNVIPNNITTGPQFIISPTTPTNVVAGTPFTFAGVLSGFTNVPTLTYSINGSTAAPLAGVTATGWNTLLVATATGPTTIVVTDQADVASGSCSFTVLSTAPVGNPVTWNPNDLISVALSAGNTVATGTGSATPYSTPQGVRATSPISPGSVVLWETVFSAVTQNAAVGIADADFALNLHAGLGGDGNGIGAYPSTGTGSQPAQTVYYTSAQLTAGNGINSVAPFPVTMAINGTNFFFSDPAMRSTSGVVWNNSATADPVANIGGLSFTGVNTPFYPVFYTGESGAAVMLNDGTVAFSAFAANYLAAHSSVVTLSGQQSTTPAKSVTPNAPSGIIVSTAFTFSGVLSGYTTPPVLTYTIDNGSPQPITNVTTTAWAATITIASAGSHTISVTDGTITGSTTFVVSTTQTVGQRVTAPLSPAATSGTWVVNQRFTYGSGSPSGTNQMQYNYLLPAQYNSNLVYPILFIGHPIGSGMNGSVYPKDGNQFVNANFINSLYTFNSIYNTVAFRTAHPCIVVACQCDQTGNGSGTAANGVPGYNDTAPNGSWNERAECAILQAFIAGTIVANLKVDPAARYHLGYSLGGIDTLAQLVDNNQFNGPGIPLWTAGITYSDQLVRSNQSNSSVFARMSIVPLMTFSFTGDNVPGSFDQPAYSFNTGGSTNYPTKATYDSGGVAACRAGTSNYYYVNNGGGNTASAFMPMNADGGDGTAAYAWLFAQFGPGTIAPNATLTGVTISANTAAAGATVGTSVGTLTVTASGATPTGVILTISSQSTAGAFSINGTTLQVANGSLTAGSYTVSISVSATNATNAPQIYPITITVTSATARYRVSGGQLLNLSGVPYKGGGINISEGNLDSAVTDSLARPMTTLFPNMNMVRLAAHSYVTVAQIQQFVTRCTGAGIIVEIENHQSFNANGTLASTGGGGTGVIYTGSNLSREGAWYATLAAAFAGNPRVWFGTNNEPSVVDPNTGQSNVPLLCTWMRSTYNSIRNAGNNNPVLLCVNGPSMYGTAGGMTQSSFTGMTNVMWDMHKYNWTENYSNNLATVNTRLNQMIALLSTITSADGVIPISCLEFGNSTTGTSLDAGGTQNCQAVQNATTDGRLVSNAAYTWDFIGIVGNQLRTGNNTTLSSFGQFISSWIQNAPLVD